MVWIVQPLQRKSDMTWQLIAESDEGGGFVSCCVHPHPTFDEAQACKEAGKRADEVTGMAGIPRRIQLNRMTAAENAIRNAMLAVERAGCSKHLTDAINLLSQASKKVADHVDGLEDLP